MTTPSKTILVAGAGIAGLTAALAFVQRGFDVSIFEQAEKLDEIGAGIQLSPNATRILDRLGVMEALRPHAVCPDAVVLRRASTLAEVARVPLGELAEKRWGAPYLVAHRADLQNALLETVARYPAIQLTTGAAVRDFAIDSDGASLSIDAGGERRDERGLLVVGADGVWSTIRGLAGQTGESRFIGELAWRRTIDATDGDAAGLLEACEPNVVTAFLHPGFHLIAYPVRGGAAINLAAFTKFKRDMKAGWAERPDPGLLAIAMRGTAPALSRLAEGGDRWTAWPIHVADLDGAWTHPGGLALIGDAAHAMTPFAAQGAAMAIEDAETLAAAVASRLGELGAALETWTVARRRRVLRVARRGALNHFAWHARGPVAMARDLFLKARGPEGLAGDLDWLYGWRPGAE